MKNIISKIQKRLMRSCAKSINYVTLKQIIKENKNAILIDVRTEDEYVDKHLQGAINIPMQEIKEKIEKITNDKNCIIILYCQHGSRSKKAGYKLEKMGYNNIYTLEGGIEEVY